MGCSNLKRFIPMSREEMSARGWSELDVLFITGDAYVDHPSFGVVLLARLLENRGFRVGIVAQPRFSKEEEALEDLRRLGVPRLFVGIGSGVVDSMLNNYTASKRPRSDDMYAPGGRGGRRPDNAAVVYSRLARRAFPGKPIIVGGVEASLRRLAHYDYWQNRVRASVLIDSEADLLVFGMAERQVVAIAEQLRDFAGAGAALSRLRGERGIAWVASRDVARAVESRLQLPSFEEVRDDKKAFARASRLIEQESNPLNARVIVQDHGQRSIIVNPPVLPLSVEELDAVHALPFTREAHFTYSEKIPAEEMIRFSVQACRGCFGGCSFCALTLHQGRIVQSRSQESVLREIESLKTVLGFKGIVSDVGGPTANSYGLRCGKPEAQAACRKPSCLHPVICPNLLTDHGALINLLRRARALPGIRKILIASGLRFDLALRDRAYLKELVTHHVGGHLKVAPEHIDAEVLRLMRKPTFENFCEFQREFEKHSKEAGKEQYLVPYFISAFPGSTPAAMSKLQEWLGKQGWKLQQVQSFIPTPMTYATAMYWTGIDPVSRKPVFVARDFNEKKVQQALLQPHRARHGRFLKRKKQKKVE